MVIERECIDGRVRAYAVRVVDAMRWTSVLSDEEVARSSAFVRAADRDRFLAARATVRRLVSDALGVTPAALVFGTGNHKKPFILSPPTRSSFNVSHSGAWIALAISETDEVGVDVEQVDPAVDVLELASPVASARELADLRGLPADARRRAFFRLWTRKEAALKAWGTGLYLEPRTVEVGIDDASRRAASTPGRPDCLVEDFDVDDGYYASVAVTEHDGGHRVSGVREPPTR